MSDHLCDELNKKDNQKWNKKELKSNEEMDSLVD